MTDDTGSFGGLPDPSHGSHHHEPQQGDSHSSSHRQQQEQFSPRTSEAPHTHTVPPANTAAEVENLVTKNENKFTGLFKKTFSGKKGLALAAGAIVLIGAVTIGAMKRPDEKEAGAQLG